MSLSREKDQHTDTHTVYRRWYSYRNKYIYNAMYNALYRNKCIYNALYTTNNIPPYMPQIIFGGDAGVILIKSVILIENIVFL